MSENAVDIAPLLAELKNPSWMDTLKQARFHYGRYRAPELEPLAHQIATNPSYDEDEASRRTRELLFDIVGADFNSPELFDAVYLMRKRALMERRARHEATAPNPLPSQLGALPRFTVPNMEERIASLLPLMDDACEGVDLIDFLAGHPDPAAFELLRDLYLRSAVAAEQCTSHLASLLKSLDQPAASQGLATRIRWLVAQPASAARDQELQQTISQLGALPVEAQIDLQALQRDVMQHPATPELHAQLDLLFTQQLAAAQRAGEFTAENLAYWLGQARLDIAQSFLAHGADVNPADKSWGTPLMNALVPHGGLHAATDEPKYDTMIKLLVDRGARVSEPEFNDVTPLHVAAAFRSIKIVDLLVTHGAAVNARESQNCATPVFSANRDDILIYLLDHQADINARLCDGTTMLLQAIEERNAKRVQLLIDRGADVNLGSKNGLSPLLVAHLRADGATDHDFENLLRSKGATLNPIMLAKWTILKPIVNWMSTGYP